jgi:AGZA family xanthine/uracil permease-like MFS transporter
LNEVSAQTRRTPRATLLDRYFNISARGSTVGREVRGGLVTFFTMAYIVVLNPLIPAAPSSAAARARISRWWQRRPRLSRE